MKVGKEKDWPVVLKNGTRGAKKASGFWAINFFFCYHIPSQSEMEFFDINLTKDSSLLFHAFHSPFYCQILKKTILYSGFKNTYKKIREARKFEFIQE